jgi:hypothetical protein
MPQFFKLWSPVQGSGSYFSIESVVDADCIDVLSLGAPAVEYM